MNVFSIIMFFLNIRQLSIDACSSKAKEKVKKQGVSLVKRAPLCPTWDFRVYVGFGNGETYPEFLNFEMVGHDKHKKPKNSSTYTLFKGDDGYSLWSGTVESNSFYLHQEIVHPPDGINFYPYTKKGGWRLNKVKLTCLHDGHSFTIDFKQRYFPQTDSVKSMEYYTWSSKDLVTKPVLWFILFEVASNVTAGTDSQIFVRMKDRMENSTQMLEMPSSSNELNAEASVTFEVRTAKFDDPWFVEVCLGHYGNESRFNDRDFYFRKLSIWNDIHYEAYTFYNDKYLPLENGSNCVTLEGIKGFAFDSKESRPGRTWRYIIGAVVILAVVVALCTVKNKYTFAERYEGDEIKWWPQAWS